MIIIIFIQLISLKIVFSVCVSQIDDNLKNATFENFDANNFTLKFYNIYNKVMLE